VARIWSALNNDWCSSDLNSIVTHAVFSLSTMY